MDIGDLRKRGDQLAADIGEAIAAYLNDTGCKPEIEIELVSIVNLGGYQNFVPIVTVHSRV